MRVIRLRVPEVEEHQEEQEGREELEGEELLEHQENQVDPNNKQDRYLVRIQINICRTLVCLTNLDWLNDSE